MAAAEQLNVNTEVEYEIIYFEQDSLQRIQIRAESKKQAHKIYLEMGKHVNDLYSIRPDE